MKTLSILDWIQDAGSLSRTANRASSAFPLFAKGFPPHFFNQRLIFGAFVSRQKYEGRRAVTGAKSRNFIPIEYIPNRIQDAELLISSVLQIAPLKKGVHRKRAGKEEKENSCLSPQGEFCFSPLCQWLSTSFFQSALDFLVLLYQDKSTEKEGP